MSYVVESRRGLFYAGSLSAQPLWVPRKDAHVYTDHAEALKATQEFTPLMTRVVETNSES